jgi:hypothetical protein
MREIEAKRSHWQERNVDAGRNGHDGRDGRDFL